MFFSKSIEFFCFKRGFILKNLHISKRRCNGRNNKGIIVFYHRGGGSKNCYKFVDFFRLFYNVPAIVRLFEYDSVRNSYVALICYINGFLSYIIAPTGLNINSFVISGIRVPVNVGNQMCLFYFPIGSLLYNVSIRRYKKSILARAAGTLVQVLKKVSNHIALRLPSKEERILNGLCVGTYGVVSNVNYKFKRQVKASDRLFTGFKPIVRGVAKNPIDHPHGGGEGRTTAGRPSVTPWGVYTKGVKTTSKYERYEKSNLWRILVHRRKKLGKSL